MFFSFLLTLEAPEIRIDDNEMVQGEYINC